MQIWSTANHFANLALHAAMLKMIPAQQLKTDKCSSHMQCNIKQLFFLFRRPELQRLVQNKWTQIHHWALNIMDVWWLCKPLKRTMSDRYFTFQFSPRKIKKPAIPSLPYWCSIRVITLLGFSSSCPHHCEFWRCMLLQTNIIRST